MGIQSQNRNGSIKWCKKNAHKRRKTPLNATKGGRIQSSSSPFPKRAFIPEINCILCRAYCRRRFNPLIRIPHRGHHKLCSLNKTTKDQLSKRPIEVLAPPAPAPLQVATHPLLPAPPAPLPRLILPALAPRQMAVRRLQAVMPMNVMWHPAYQVNLAPNAYPNTCCTKNLRWKLNDRRMGRPPHDLDCKNHPRNKNK
jgi:hypothetical protein